MIMDSPGMIYAEEDVLDEVPILGRSSVQIEICPIPAAPKRSRVKCRKSHGKRMCKASCLKGFKLPDGNVTQIISCNEDDGIYTPREAFVDCEAYCHEPCENGGKCIGNNECVCKATFRGQRCEYAVSLCDGHFSEFLGTWRCSHQRNGTICSLSCPDPFYFEFESPHTHRCSIEGIWTPSRVPTCVADDPELELIPGEVTRDEMEQARGTKKDGNDHDHYEIYETIYVDEPEKESNAVVVEAQDASSNIIRRKKCPTGEERVKCVPSCEATCDRPDISCPPTPEDECVEGCVCPQNYVRHGENCVPRKACPCYHEGFIFENGRYIVQDCNTCTCKDGEWACTREVCDSECAVLVNSFYVTFDGKGYYTGAGSCAFVLMQITDGPQIIQDRSSCPEDATEVCVGDVVINLNDLSIRVTSDLRVLKDHRELRHLPIMLPHQITLSRPTHEFIQVDVKYISILTNGKSQISIKASPTFFNKTVGLCGTFNHQRADDFTTPNNDITTSSGAIAESWLVEMEGCKFTPVTSCPSNGTFYFERLAICQKLYRDESIFQGCNDKVAPEEYYSLCLNVLCSCSSETPECLCPVISYYAQLCANKGVITDWQSQLPQCTSLCHQGMQYQYCQSGCHASCAHRSHFGPNCTQGACVEGCACPAGQTFSTTGTCIPYDSCMCYFDNREYPDGFRQSRTHQNCECRKGFWHCEASTDECDNCTVDAVEMKCPDPEEVFSQCVTSCEPTCKNLKVKRDECDNGVCHPGCTCANGYVRDERTRKCIRRSECPCIHGGLQYNEGESVHRECNKCTCVDGTWKCADAPCPGQCDVWGDTHVKTFDGEMLDFDGQCDYVIVRADSESLNSGWFQVILRNFRCATPSAHCRKSVVVQYENHSATLIRNTWHLSREAPLSPQHVGLFTKMILPNQLTVYWDGNTRLYVIAGIQWKERLLGLCGNYNGDDTDELQVSSGGPQVHSVQTFVKDWQLHKHCKLPAARDLQCRNESKKLEAQSQCAVLKGPLFEDCHNDVDVEPYLERCLADACSCHDLGNCECVCTAIAAYAHRCAQRGVPVRWRHQDLCPMQCDEDCERYTPCVPDACANSQTCQMAIEQGVQMDCHEPVCVEGCALPKCKAGYIRLNASTHECVPSSQCGGGHVSGLVNVEPVFCRVADGKGNGQVYREGDRMPSNDSCVSCFCMRGATRCIGQPCTQSLININCFDGWSDWRSDNSPPDAFGRDLEYLVYHKCPRESIVDLECRRIHDHEMWNPYTMGVSCDKSRGLECEPHDLQPCDDWEIRVQCSCPVDPSEVVSIDVPPASISDAQTCLNGQQWSTCGIDCSQTCHNYRKNLMLQGHCLDKECIPGCREECPQGQVLFGPNNCVPIDHCPCVLPSGEIVPPGEVRVKDECHECQCLRNEMICQELSKCEQQREGTVLTETKVLPPEMTEGCWTQWISTDNADAAGDFEKLRLLIGQGLVCERPTAIQCQTKESHLSPGGIDWTATGQTLTCDVNSGLSCFHTANPGDGCFDYQVKFYCPCDEVEGITYDNRVSTPPSAVVVEFLCPEANGLFPDPVNCDHFYHCSNNIPFHKPCAPGTLFHPVLKICDHHGNVQCGQGEVLVPIFKCTVPNGLFRDPSNCHWFYQCVNGVAYHKLCPVGLSFNIHTGNCDYTLFCEQEPNAVMPDRDPDVTPPPLPLMTITEPPRPVMILACPEVGANMISMCPVCEVGLLCDGQGFCVPPERCSCVRDGKIFPVGGRVEVSSCQQCSCQLGGHSICSPIVCPPCQNNRPGIVDNTCRCVCVETEAEYFACQYKCGNGQCLDASRVCDGIVDCDTDEMQCHGQMELEPSPSSSYDLVLDPATCELIGNHLKTFDGQEFSYDYCRNVFAKDVANGLFSIVVSRECSSIKHCEAQLFFKSGEQEVQIFPQSQVVIVNGQPFNAAQLASAEPFGGTIKVLLIGDVIELTFRGNEVRLVLTSSSMKAIVSPRFSKQLMGLCGLFNYNEKDDMTNPAGMVIDNVKQFADAWTLPPSPGALCVSHTCKPEVTLEAMDICRRLSSPPFSACVEMKNAFKDCLAATCHCLQLGGAVNNCTCNAYTAFQTACVNSHGHQIINQMAGWRQRHSCAPKCPPDQEYHDCGPQCVVTCQNFFETGQLTCVSNDTGTCISGCFCPVGLVIDYTTNSCIEPESCADKVCVGYGDPQMKTFDGWSFSLGKAGEFNIASDHDGLFTVHGVIGSCAKRMVCVVGLDVKYNGHLIRVRRNELTEIDGHVFSEEMLPWKSPDSTLSVFSLQSGSYGTTVISLSRLGVRVHYSNEDAGFSIHVPSKKFFDKMEGLCGNCNNDPNDDMKLKDGETTDDIYGFICSWGRFESEQNRRECIMEFDGGEVPLLMPAAVAEACEQMFNGPTIFAGCHALVSYEPYAQQCMKEASSLSVVNESYMSAVCNSALEYSRRCCEHGIALQWWTNIGCNTTCPGDLIYSPCVDACPQGCDEISEYDECRRIRMDGCVCPPNHIRDGIRCIPKTHICTTPAEDCRPASMTNSISVFEYFDLVHGRCANQAPVTEAAVCSGTCHSTSAFKREDDIESACGCCVPVKWAPILVELACNDGATIHREFRRPTACNCQPCGSLGMRNSNTRAIKFTSDEESPKAPAEQVSSSHVVTSTDPGTKITHPIDDPKLALVPTEDAVGLNKPQDTPPTTVNKIKNSDQEDAQSLQIPDAQ
ncbi:hemocytin-like isoform X2 [Varroa destructor]|uniref:Hemocytin n=1 Tax=Varroa destructor TaxID=109461 RepID=A0A7M7JLL1_VARDE|nr:hemocytin-like isoform X2 [Varroa destructor]